MPETNTHRARLPTPPELLRRGPRRPTPPELLRRGPRLAAALLAVVTAAWLARAAGAFLADPPALHWDEGVHLSDALDAAQALEGPAKDLLLWMDAPQRNPFVHPLLVALGWKALGLGETPARLVALLSTLLIVPGLWLLARAALPRERADPAALLAALLVLGMPELLRLQCAVMLDATGTCLTVWALAAWVWWLERDTWPRAALTAALVLAAFFTKYNYGVVLGLALGIHGALARAGVRRLFRASVLIAPAALLWLYQEPAKKLEIVWEYAWKAALEKGAVERAVWPARAFAVDLAAWVPLGLLVLGAWLWAWRRLPLSGPAGVLLVLPALLAALLVATAEQWSRYLMPAAPAVHLAAAAVLVEWASRERWRRGRRAAAAALGAVLLIAVATASPERVLAGDLAWGRRAELRAILDAIAGHRYLGRPLVLVGGFRELPPSLGRWERVRRHDRRSGPTPWSAPPLFVPPPPAYAFTTTHLAPLPARDALAAVERAATAYARAWCWAPTYAVIELLPDSAYRTPDYQAFNAWQEVVAEVVRRSGARLDRPARSGFPAGPSGATAATWDGGGLRLSWCSVPPTEWPPGCPPDPILGGAGGLMERGAP